MNEMSQVMKLSSNGQVSIPAEVRARWQADRMIVVDLGDMIVMRPYPEDPVGSLAGKYAGRGPSTDDARVADRRNDRHREADRDAATTRGEGTGATKVTRR